MVQGMINGLSVAVGKSFCTSPILTRQCRNDHVEATNVLCRNCNAPSLEEESVRMRQDGSAIIFIRRIVRKSGNIQILSSGNVSQVDVISRMRRLKRLSPGKRSSGHLLV